MRSLCLISLALLSAHTLRADDTAAIEWSPDRPLSWADFVGAVPVRADAERVAATTASLSWSYQFSLAWSADTCTYRIESIDSAALFHPDSSWVRAGHRTDRVLEHEQGHFNITQLYRELFDKETRPMVGGPRMCRGNRQQRATRFAEEEIAREVGSIYEDVWQRYRDQQEIYDLETRHGMDSAAQSEWTAKLATQLQAANQL